MTRRRPGDVLTYQEAATALGAPGSAAVAQLVTLGLLEGRSAPGGEVVTHASVEALRRRRSGVPFDRDPNPLVGVCSGCGTRFRQSADRCPACGSQLPLQRFLDAVRAGDVARAATQLAHDPRLVNATAAGDVGRTPLHRAAATAHAAMVQLLLAHGAQVNAVDTFGITPLHVGAAHGVEAVVLALLDHGANPHARQSGHLSPAQVAAARGHAAIEQLLRTWVDPHAGASVRPSDPGDNTAPS